MDYIKLIEIKRLYNDTPPETIKSNIRLHMTATNTKHEKIMKLLDITTNTAYSYTNIANKGKPDLINLLILADYFHIDVRQLLES